MKKTVKIRTGVKSGTRSTGLPTKNHNQSRKTVRVRTGVKAGGAVLINHSQVLARRAA